MIVWVAPAVALLALGLLVIVSSRARTTQEANQLGGAVILPLIFVAAGPGVGADARCRSPGCSPSALLVWIVALVLVWVNSRRFTRDRLAASG